MKKNVGKIDKAIRLSVAVILAVLILTQVISGAWLIISLILLSILLLTGMVGFCPLYRIIGVNSINEEKSAYVSQNPNTRGN